jgi:hypothetical protein
MVRPTSSGERVLLDLEQVARVAAQEAIDAEKAKLSEEQKEHVMFGANLCERWAVFDWYLPGARQRDAFVMVRASVGRTTGEVVVDQRPSPASRPKGTPIRLTLFAVVTPIFFTACFLLMIALLNYIAGKGGPTVDGVISVGPISWFASQLIVLIILYDNLTCIPIRLPDGKLLYVNRVCLKTVRATKTS